MFNNTSPFPFRTLEYQVEQEAPDWNNFSLELSQTAAPSQGQMPQYGDDFRTFSEMTAQTATLPEFYEQPMSHNGLTAAALMGYNPNPNDMTMQRDQTILSWVFSGCGPSFNMFSTHVGDIQQHQPIQQAIGTYNGSPDSALAPAAEISAPRRGRKSANPNKPRLNKCTWFFEDGSRCTSAFNRASDLRRHQCSHTKERNYPCHCGKSFLQSSALKVHNRIHTGEKPYKCAYCTTSEFADSSSKARHEKSHKKRGHLRLDGRPE